MKKALLKKLQSLTAILALNTLPMSVAHATLACEAEALQSRVLTEEKKLERTGHASPPESLKTLLFENSLSSIQKKAEGNYSDQALLALALIEESYQDQYDSLLDHYELALLSADSETIPHIKVEAKEMLSSLKSTRNKKMAEVKFHFS